MFLVNEYACIYEVYYRKQKDTTKLTYLFGKIGSNITGIKQYK